MWGLRIWSSAKNLLMYNSSKRKWDKMYGIYSFCGPLSGMFLDYDTNSTQICCCKVWIYPESSGLRNGLRSGSPNMVSNSNHERGTLGIQTWKEKFRRPKMGIYQLQTYGLNQQKDCLSFEPPKVAWEGSYNQQNWYHNIKMLKYTTCGPRGVDSFLG